MKTKEDVLIANSVYAIVAYALLGCSIAFASYVAHDICKTVKERINYEQ